MKIACVLYLLSDPNENEVKELLKKYHILRF